jgi:S-adenosylmethionine hydrolase
MHLFPKGHKVVLVTRAGSKTSGCFGNSCDARKNNCIILTEGRRRAIVAMNMRFISLLTDFGLKDGYVGVMKGVIWGIAPQVQIADITHLIQPQNILEGALALGRAALYFPADTVHVAVVDPGVGTARRPIAAQLGEHFFVGPDNGLCTLLVAHARQAGGPVRFVHLNQPRYWLAEISNVFHGRDIFSPVAAHLVNGVPLEVLGSLIDNPHLIQLPVPERTTQGWRGQVLWVDNFGNLSTNLTAANLAVMDQVVVRIAGREVHGLVNTFGDRQPGELVAMLDSSGALSICVINGDAAARLNVEAGEMVEISNAR